MAGKDNKPYDARLGGARRKGALPLTDKSKRSNSAGIIFNILIILFIGYAFYSYLQKGGDAGVLNDLGEQLKVIDAPKNSDPRVDSLRHRQQLNVISRAFPKKRSVIAKKVMQEGSGLPASCGQIAEYRLISGYGSEQKVSEVKKLRLGSIDAPQGLTLALEGMRAGEVAQISIPQELWAGVYPAEDQPSRVTNITLELQSVSPEVPRSEMPLRRFIIRGGSGYPLRCGDLAMVHMMVWSASGKKIFSSEADKPVYLYLGEGKTPYGLERGLLDMAPGGLYSMVIPAELWQNIAPETDITSAPPPYDVQPFPSDLKLPQGQMILVDINYPKEPPHRTLQAPPTPATEASEQQTQLTE